MKELILIGSLIVVIAFGAIYWYYAKEFSDKITPSVFKSFPREVIDFEWPCKKDFTVQSYLDACWWHEDFIIN